MPVTTLTPNRRTLLLALLSLPLTGLGCGGNAVSENVQVGERRIQKIEVLRKKAESKRKIR